MAINWGKPQPAPTIVWDLIGTRFPRASFMGIMREPQHQDHSEGRALDVGLDATNHRDRQLAYDLIRVFRAVKDEVGWSYLIWNKQIWFSDRRGGPFEKFINGKQQFDGDHVDHIHFSWEPDTSQRSSFPRLILELDRLLNMGKVEDTKTQASYYKPSSG